MSTSRYLPISKAAKQAKTSSDYLHKLRQAGQLPAIFEQKGKLKYWLIDTESERYKKLLTRHEEKPAAAEIQTNHPVDWTLWEDMCRAGEEIVKYRLSPTTLNEYKRYITNFFGRYQELSRDSLRAALVEYEKKATRERDYFTAKRMLHQALMTIARYYVHKGYETPDFVHNLTFLRPKPENTVVSRPCHTASTVYSALEKAETAKNQKGVRAFTKYDAVLNQTLIRLAFCTGARSSEICGIRLKDLDLNKDSLILFGKGGKQRYVGIPKDLKKALKAYLVVRPKNDSEHLFLNRRGNPLNKDSVGRKIRNVGKYIKTQKFNPHSLRRTAITHMLTHRKAPMPVVRDIVGHSNLSVTNLYAQPTANDIIDTMKDW